MNTQPAAAATPGLVEAREDTGWAASWANRRGWVVAVLFLVALLCLEFPGVVLVRQLPFVTEMVQGSDLFTFNYPVRHLLGEALRRGSFPLWTTGMNSGFPIHAEGQGGFLYPPNMLLALLPLAASLCLSFVTSYLAAGLFTFLLARELGRSLPASLLAAAAFMLSGFMFGHIRHMNVVSAAQWLPLVLLCCERYARTRRPAWLLAVAPVHAIQHLAGHPQVTYYGVLFAGLYLLVRMLHECPTDAGTPRWRAALAAGAGFAGASALGAGLAGAQLLPSWELAQIADRPARGSFRQATFHTLPLSHLITLVAPFAFGDPGRDSYSFFWGRDSVIFWENCGYVGLVPLALALFGGAVCWRRERRVALLAGAALLALLLATGKQTALFPLLWHVVPGMGAFRVASRFLLITDLALALLAAWGLDTLRRRLAASAPRSAPAVVGLLLALSAADLLWFSKRHYGLVDARAWLRPPPAAEALRREPVGTVFSWHCDRVWLAAVGANGGWQRNAEALRPLLDTLLPNYSLLHGVPHFGYYSGFTMVEKGLVMAQAGHLLNEGSPAAVRRALRLLGHCGVSHVLAPDDLAPGGAQRLASFAMPGRPPGRVHLYRNPLALPHAYLSASAVSSREQPEVLARMLAHDFDPTRAVVVEGAVRAAGGGHPGSPPPLAGGTVRWERRLPGDLALVVAAPRSSWLVMNETWYPGWRATVDGRPAALYRANLVGRALQVPAGRHRVALRYDPASWGRGLALSGVSLVALALAALACRRYGS